MSEYSSQAIWLTQEAYDKLRDELDHLSGPGRAAMAQKIAQAREEGDLRENGGYHAARDEQGQQELRIRQLSDMLAERKSVKPRQRLVRLLQARASRSPSTAMSQTPIPSSSAHASCSDWTRASTRPTSTARNPPSGLPSWASAKGKPCPTLLPTADRSMSR